MVLERQKCGIGREDARWDEGLDRRLDENRHEHL
jgi:hypothetical protein